MNILLEINIMDDCSFQDNICITSLYLVRVTNSVCFAYQCDNGHVACSSCCTKLRYMCPACTLSIGNYRCRIMEKVIKAIIVPCPNAKHGCTKTFSYGKELVHEKKCSFALCYCPEPNCNYSGIYKDLYSHYDADHKKNYDHFSCNSQNCDYITPAWLRLSEKILVLKEYRGGPIVVIQSFKEPEGVYVTVNCIAPSAPGVGEFSYDLSYTNPVWVGGDGTIMSFKSPKMNRIQKVSSQTPEKNFMLVPHYFQGQRDSLKMEILIHRLEKDEEEEEEDEEEAEEEEEDED